MNKAIFLDRDGTINVDKNYLYKIEDWEFIDGVIEGLQILQKLGFKLIVITNQSGIARGYYTENDAHKIFNYMIDELEKYGVIIEKVYYCPHLEENCECRKPKLGLFYQAQKEYDIDLAKSYAIGDKIRDLAICEKEETKGFILNSKEEVKNNKVKRCSNLLEAAKMIEKMEKGE
mgnify:CR=1 FL=1